ncbi:hypothetical protein GCM10023307_30770 [Lysobacter hankyongensis]|uniref:Uncharacterized protein n=2 Tax=Lysobacter hankyongensis TaxID=1176535 RepID=A0ABP9BXN0_9GAMM
MTRAARISLPLFDGISMTARLHRIAALAGLSASLFVATVALPHAAVAQSNALPMPLESRDPAKPLTVIADQTWTGPEIQAQAKDFSRLEVGSFKYDASQGPVILLIDYAATWPDPENKGEAIIDVGIECPEARDPCAIPITLGTIGIHTEYMGESVVNVGPAPQAAWIGRESHAYTFPQDTYVEVRLALQDRRNLDPKAIRARLFYGDHDRDALPGQKTRFGAVMKVALALGVLLALLVWWMRRG